MKAGPYRAHALRRSLVGIPKPKTVTCPKCFADPGHSCIVYTTDSDGNQYVQRLMKGFHPERKDVVRAPEQ